MKIQFNQNTKFDTALTLAANWRYYDAMLLFADIHTYESYLNQICCLCHMRDLDYAVDIYRYTKQIYGGEYAVYKDVRGLENIEEYKDLLDVCESSKSYAVRVDGKKRADKNLLVHDALDPDDGYPYDEEEFDPDMDEYFDYDESAANLKVFEKDSVAYLNYLRMNIMSSYVLGQKAEYEKYVEEFLNAETDDIPSLQLQISIITECKKYKSGVKYAERLADSGGGTHLAIHGAIKILFNTNPKKYADLIRVLLERAEKNIKRVVPNEMTDYLYVATQCLHDYRLANVFAEKLYEKRQFGNLETLKMCVYAFYNVKNFKKAAEAANYLCRAVPLDYTAKLLKKCVDQQDPDEIFVPFDIAARQIRHFFVPEKLGTLAKNHCKDIFDKSRANPDDVHKLDKNDLMYLSVLISWCKSLLICNRDNDYNESMSIVRGILSTCDFCDDEELFRFAKLHIYSIANDRALNEFLIGRMIVSGYRGKVLVSLPNNSYYKLDCSFFDNIPGYEMFYYIFGVAAAICPVDDVEKYWNAFVDITEKVGVDVDDELLIVRYAYALLVLCAKDFENGLADEYFNEADKKVLNDYRAKISG